VGANVASRHKQENRVETVGLGFFFEDLPVGRQFKTIGRTVTEADITNFVNCTGMVEVLFTNTEFLAHESDIKGRPAPGALVYCFAEGLLVQATMQHTGFAFLHMELTIENPIVARDTIHSECEIIEGWARQHDKREVMKAFAGRGIPCGAVLDTAEALSDAHLRERGTIVDLDHPTRGRFSTIISPLRLSESPVEPRRAPLFGEHTADVLHALAGYSDAEITALREKGVITLA